jgi:predicted MFS family arabinose efflux permease
MKTVKEFEQKLVKENPEIWDFLRQLRRKKVIKVIFFCALVIFGTVMTIPYSSCFTENLP